MRHFKNVSQQSKIEGFFYSQRHAKTVASARAILRPLFDGLQPRNVVDFGCGVGTWLKVSKEFGAQEILGLDGGHMVERYLVIPSAAFKRVELSKPVELGKVFDLVISCEVAEHIEELSAQIFVSNLVHAGPVVLFSAAVPGQGGHHHCNEQWPAYWAARFAEHGYHLLDFIRPLFWNHSEIMPWYRQNTMLFVTASAVEKMPASWRYDRHGFQGLPVVHPEIFRAGRSSPSSKGLPSISGRTAVQILLKALARRLRTTR